MEHGTDRIYYCALLGSMCIVHFKFLSLCKRFLIFHAKKKKSKIKIREQRNCVFEDSDKSVSYRWFEFSLVVSIGTVKLEYKEGKIRFSKMNCWLYNVNMSLSSVRDQRNVCQINSNTANSILFIYLTATTMNTIHTWWRCLSVYCILYILRKTILI